MNMRERLQESPIIDQGPYPYRGDIPQVLKDDILLTRQEAFHDIFVRCRDQGVSLHRNFLPLGIYLACLHDHLGTLGGGPFDVRTAFENATG